MKEEARRSNKSYRVVNEDDIRFVSTLLLTNCALHTEAKAIPYTRRQALINCKLRLKEKINNCYSKDDALRVRNITQEEVAQVLRLLQCIVQCLKKLRDVIVVAIEVTER